MAKPNIRSFRYSNEVAEILEAQRGNSLNVKFENLVTDCYLMLERRQRMLEQVNEQIEARRRVLRNLETATAELQMLQRDIEAAKRYFAIIERRAKSIAEKTEV